MISMHSERNSDQDQHPSVARLVVLLRAISDYGGFLSMVLLVSYVSSITSSAIYVGLFLASRVIGGICASAFARRYFARVSDMPAFLALDLMRGVALLALLIAPETLRFPLLLGVGFTLGLCGATLAIGVNHRMPSWVGPARVGPMNGWVASAASLGAVAGSFSSGAAIATVGYEWTIGFNALVFFVAALVVMVTMRALKAAPAIASSQAPPAQEDPSAKPSWMMVCRQAPVLSVLLLVAMFDTLGSAAHNVGFPYLSRFIFPDDAEFAFGVTLACWAVGKFLGAQYAGRRAKVATERSLEDRYLWAVAGMSLFFILTFNSPSMAYVVPLVMMSGLCDGLAEVNLITRIQKLESSKRMVFLGAFTFMHMTGFGVGMLAVSPFFDYYTHDQVVTCCHAIPLCAVLAAFVRLKGYRSGR